MRRLRQNWPLLYLVATFLIAGFLFLLSGAAAQFIGDLFYNRYDNRSFFYWAIYYPAISFVSIIPISFAMLLAVWIILRLKNRPSARTKPMHYALVALFIAAILASGWLILDFTASSDGPYPRHLTSVQLAGATYNLGIVSLFSRDIYVLYECDSIGLFCAAVHVEERVAFSDPLTHLFSKLQVVIDPSSNMPSIALELDGQIVYTASP